MTYVVGYARSDIRVEELMKRCQIEVHVGVGELSDGGAVIVQG